MDDEQLEPQIQQVLTKFRSLTPIWKSDSGTALEGELRFSTRLAQRTVKEAFCLRIEIPSGFPRKLPRVFSTDKRIPADFHTNPDGSLCLETPMKMRMVLNSEPTIINYIEQLVVPFLATYALYRDTGMTPFGVRQHGGHGLLLSYKEILGTPSTLTTARFLLMLAGGENYRRQPCPCGSGKRFGGCHKKRVARLRRLQSCDDFYEDYAQVMLYLLTSGIEVPQALLSDKLIGDIRSLTNQKPE